MSSLLISVRFPPGIRPDLGYDWADGGWDVDQSVVLPAQLKN